jgi:hypothetical protein
MHFVCDLLVIYFTAEQIDFLLNLETTVSGSIHGKLRAEHALGNALFEVHGDRDTIATH